MIHEIWKELAAVALVGTQRTAPPVVATGDPRVDALLAQLDPAKREEYVLQAAAILSLVMKAGQLPESIVTQPTVAGTGSEVPAQNPDIQALAAIQPAPAETLPVCSDAASADFLVLIATEKALLPEWLIALAATGRRLRPETLPEALEWAVTQGGRADLIRPVLGARGEWLAAANPMWHKVLEPKVETAALWEQGINTFQRAKGLRAIRSEDPAKARDLLQAVWRTEASQDRAEFIETLEERLSMDDVPFLETALADKRKEVREHAVRLLKRLPSSPFCQRMRERAAACVEWQKGMLYGGKFAFDPPQKPTPEMESDGITVTNVGGGRGAGAQILRHILVATPLDFWAVLMGRKPDDPATPAAVIGGLAGSDYEDTALGSIATAAAGMRNTYWIQGWLREISRNPELLKYWDANEFGEALASLPPEEERSEWIKLLQLFEGKPLKLLKNPINALTTSGRPWSGEFTIAAYKLLKANRLQARTRYGQGSDWESSTVWAMLMATAHLQADMDVPLPPFVWPELSEEEKKSYYGDGTGASNVEKLLVQLDLRKRLRGNLMSAV